MACKSVLLGLWIAVTAAAATAAEATAAPETPIATITVSDAWVRWLPANLPAGGYVTLRNTGIRAQTLTGATSPCAACSRA